MTALLSLAFIAGAGVSSIPVSAEQPPARQIALQHLREHASEFGLVAADLTDVTVTSTATSEHTGVTHVYLRQRYAGIEISGADMTVNIDRTSRVVSAVGDFVPRLAQAIQRPATPMTSAAAVRRAADHLGLGTITSLRVVQSGRGSDRQTVLTSGGISSRNIPAHLVFHRTAPGIVRLGWMLEIEPKDAQHWWVVTVDAESGAVLDVFDRVKSGGTLGR